MTGPDQSPHREPGSGNSARWIWAAIALGILAPLLFVWGSGLTLVHRDQTGQYAPLRWMIGEALRAGSLPLWNPYCATGMPYLAETMHGLLHPFSLATALLFPGNELDPLIGAYLLSAGAGAACLARVLGASPAASVIAAFVYALSGYTLSMTSNMVNLAGAGSVPWILAGLRYLGIRQSAWGLVGAAVAVAAGALSGDVQELAVAVVIGVVLAFDGGGKRGAALALGATLVGMLLAGIQLAPSWSYLPLSNRSLPLPEYDVNQWDLSLWRLVELVTPGFFYRPEDGFVAAPVFQALGDPTWFNIPFAESIYLGIATLVLAWAGIRNNRGGRILVTLTLLVLWFAMGRHLGARFFQNLVPIAKGFRYGEKFLPAAIALTAVLASLGGARLAGDPLLAKRYRKVALWAAGGFLLLWGALLVNRPLLVALLGDLGDPLRRNLIGGLPHAVGSALGLAGCLHLAAAGRRNASLSALAALVWVAAISSAPLALRPGHREARLTAAPPRIVAPAPGPRVLNVRGPLARPPRAGWDSIDQLNFDVLSSLGANTNARYRIDNMDVDTGLFPLRWYRLHEAWGPGFARAARRYGVTHVIFPTPKTENGKAIVADATAGGARETIDPRNGMEIWNVPHRPWVSFPVLAIPVPTFDRALELLIANPGADLNQVVVESAGPLAATGGRVLSLRRDRQRVEIVGESAADSLLVVNDAYWPGWRGEIDGRPATILPADALVRAVSWPAGRHTLVMTYDPPEVKVGIAISLAGLLLLGAGFLLLRRRDGQGEAPSEN